jgi:hypothetical protein
MTAGYRSCVVGNILLRSTIPGCLCDDRVGTKNPRSTIDMVYSSGCRVRAIDDQCCINSCRVRVTPKPASSELGTKN